MSISDAASVACRVRAEFQEMPDLRLTASQVRRLCDVTESACLAALNELVETGFLLTHTDGSYVRRNDGPCTQYSSSSRF